MGKILTTEEIQNLALELARNPHLMERLDDYEKQAIKKETEWEIWLYDKAVSLGMKNIPPERIEKIERYQMARRRLRIDEILKGTERIIETEPKDGLSHPQKALLTIYNGTELEEDAPLKLKNTFSKLGKPGSAGDHQRRCSGGSKKTLTQRLLDLRTIEPLITSREGLKKLEADKTAIEREYENM